VPDYTVGSQDWLYDLYSSFFQGSGVGGMQYQDEGDLNVEDWQSGVNYLGSAGAGGGIWLDDENIASDFFIGDTGDYSPLGLEWMYNEDLFNQMQAETDVELLDLLGEANEWTWEGMNLWGQFYPNPGIIQNLGAWESDFGVYMPQLNLSNLEAAKRVGNLSKSSTVRDSLMRGFQGMDTLKDYTMTGGNKDQYNLVLDTALASGRLEDFATIANIKNIEDAYMTDVFTQMGDIASQGGFDFGDFGEEDSYFEATVDPDVGSGFGAGMASSPLCDSTCENVCATPQYLGLDGNPSWDVNNAQSMEDDGPTIIMNNYQIVGESACYSCYVDCVETGTWDSSYFQQFGWED
jgi:hypothetical protein